MQNRYVGDLGDYGKYALLRAVCTPSNNLALRLGVAWYLFPNENHNNDGRHITYLKSGLYRDLDPDLHDTLSELVNSDRRSVSEIRNAAIMPQNTVFVARPVEQPPLHGKKFSRNERLKYRAAWFQEGLSATDCCDIVFVDPDNGLEVKSAPFGAPKSGKYVYWRELREFFKREQSLIVYHHTNRRSSVAQQVRALAQQFREELGEAATLIPLIYHRGSCRVFWIVLFEPVRGLIRERVDSFLASGWSEHFEIGEV